MPFEERDFEEGILKFKDASKVGADLQLSIFESRPNFEGRP